MTVEQLQHGGPTAEAVIAWRFEQLCRVGYGTAARRDFLPGESMNIASGGRSAS